MKSTKKSLFLSTISLVLCFAMLLGTTWAWFTDEVTSGVNKIVAGNLDVELYHTSKTVNEEKVTSATGTLFNDVTLWEPGAYAYETFTVKNVGTLALKYKMALNVAAFTSYNGHDLTEVLKVTTMNTAPTSRADITDGTALKDWRLNSDNVTLYPEGTPGQSSTKTFTVAIYWEPTDHDNDFNMNNGRPQPLSVDLGVQLVATQVEHEFDSFDNQYDHDADNTLPEAAKVESAMAMAAATAVAGQPTVFTASIAPAMNGAADTTKVEIDDGALTAGAYNLNVKTTDLPNSIDFEPQGNFTVVAASGVAAASTAKVATIKLNLVDENGNPAFTAAADGEKAKITTKIASGLTNVGVAYSGTANDTVISNVTYNSATGELSFCTNHFSDYYAVGDGAAYNVNTCATYGTLQEAVAALAANNTIMLLKNVNENITVDEDKSLTLDLNEKTLNGGTTASTPAIKNNGTMVIKNGTIKRDDKQTTSNWYYVIQNYGTMTFEKDSVVTNDSGEFNSTSGASLIRNYGTMNVNDGEFTQARYQVFRSGIADDETTVLTNAVLSIKAGLIDGAWSLQNYATVNISGGHVHGTLAADDGVINITGGYISHPSTGTNGTLNVTGGYVKSLAAADGCHLSYANKDADGYYPVVSGAVKNIKTMAESLMASFATVQDAVAFQKSIGTYGEKQVLIADDASGNIVIGNGEVLKIAFNDGEKEFSTNLSFTIKAGGTLNLKARLTDIIESSNLLNATFTPAKQNTSVEGHPHYYYGGKDFVALQDVVVTFTNAGHYRVDYANGNHSDFNFYNVTITPAN